MNDVENNKDLQRGASQTKHLRTTAQLPVYRTASNILFLLTEVTRDVPRKLLRFTDRVLLDASELLKTIALANEFRDEERRYYLSLALANIQVIRTGANILRKLGYIRKEHTTQLTNELKSVATQVTAWRDSLKREGQ